MATMQTSHPVEGRSLSTLPFHTAGQQGHESPRQISGLKSQPATSTRTVLSPNACNYGRMLLPPVPCFGMRRKSNARNGSSLMVQHGVRMCHLCTVSKGSRKLVDMSSLSFPKVPEFWLAPLAKELEDIGAAGLESCPRQMVDTPPGGA